mmetsp:Transcript_648/g.2475  ORF Transcript_648/g.2475 Transcript_648/m.2475 type:complete len:259 (-) Transcript_648:482-1258(-)
MAAAWAGEGAPFSLTVAIELKVIRLALLCLVSSPSPPGCRMLGLKVGEKLGFLSQACSGFSGITGTPFSSTSGGAIHRPLGQRASTMESMIPDTVSSVHRDLILLMRNFSTRLPTKTSKSCLVTPTTCLLSQSLVSSWNTESITPRIGTVMLSTAVLRYSSWVTSLRYSLMSSSSFFSPPVGSPSSPIFFPARLYSLFIVLSSWNNLTFSLSSLALGLTSSFLLDFLLLHSNSTLFTTFPEVFPTLRYSLARMLPKPW